MPQTETKIENDILTEPMTEFPLPADRLCVLNTLSGVLGHLWRNRLFLRKALVTGLVTGVLLAFLLPKRFTSTTRLMPPDRQSNSGMAVLDALMGRTSALLESANLLGLKSSGALLVDMLRSRSVADQLIDEFGLQSVYGEDDREDIRRKLAENTSIVEDPKSGVITISVTDRDPQRAAHLAQGYVRQLDRVVATLTTSAAHRERVFLEERLKVVKQNLEAAEEELSQFASKNVAIDIKEQGRALVEASATLQGQLIAAQSQLEALLQIYTENNVRVRATRAKIAALQSQLRKLSGNSGGIAGQAKATTGKHSDRLYPSIRELPLLGAKYADLYRETKVQQAVYEVLTQQYELAKVGEAKEIPSVKVLDQADVPEHHSFPRRPVVVLLTVLGSLIVAVLWLVGKGVWQEVDPRDPRKVLIAEVVGTARLTMSNWANSVQKHRLFRVLLRRGPDDPSPAL